MQKTQNRDKRKRWSFTCLTCGRKEDHIYKETAEDINAVHLRMNPDHNCFSGVICK